jgi:hypothetical protein
MQRNLIALLIGAACLPGLRAAADSYSTDAVMSLQKDQGTLNVDVKVSRLSQQEGRLVEQLVESPRITTAPGVPATLHTGPQPRDPDYSSKENVTVEVSWPYPNESGIAFCAVTIQRGNEIVSKSRLRLNIEGPGRKPLIIASRDVNPASVRVVEIRSQIYLLLEFVGKTREEVKKLAVENYGNRVRILNTKGDLTEGGFSFGAYHEVGMSLKFPSKSEAERVAELLRGGAPN